MDGTSGASGLDNAVVYASRLSLFPLASCGRQDMQWQMMVKGATHHTKNLTKSESTKKVACFVEKTWQDVLAISWRFTYPALLTGILIGVVNISFSGHCQDGTQNANCLILNVTERLNRNSERIPRGLPRGSSIKKYR